MTAKTLEPWSDGNSYKNTVWDNQKQETRPLTELEDKIIEWCLPYYNHISPACEELGYDRFEMEMFSSDDLLKAGEDIYEYLNTQKSGRKSELEKELLECIPEYLSSRQKGA